MIKSLKSYCFLYSDWKAKTYNKNSNDSLLWFEENTICSQIHFLEKCNFINAEVGVVQCEYITESIFLNTESGLHYNIDSLSDFFTQ